MAMIKIGFNTAKAADAAAELKRQYEELGKNLPTYYAALKIVLRREWIGVDEYDFEDKLCKRISEMYVKAAEATKAGVSGLANMAGAWAQAQLDNVMSVKGETGVMSEDIKGYAESPATAIQKVEDAGAITPANDIVKCTFDAIPADATRGLQSLQSGGKIITALDKFSAEIDRNQKSYANGFSSIVKMAFMGEGTEMTSKINKYLEELTKCMLEITHSIQDIKNAVNTLTTSNYQQVASEAATELETATNKVSNVREENVSRWDETM